MPTDVPPTSAPRPPTRRDTIGRHEGRAPLVCAVLGAIVAALFVPLTTDFALDDAWIHLAYAKSLRLGEGLSYNPHDWETGVSSPLWVLLLAVWPTPTETSPVVSVQMLGVLMHAVGSWAAAALVIELGRTRADAQPLPLLSLSLLAGTLVATTPVLLQGAVSGMEVPLAAALILAATWAVIAARPNTAGILGLLSVWARPEALGYALALGVGLAVLRRRKAIPGASAGWALAAGAMLAMTIWMGHCALVSGYPFPNTQYIKGTGGGLAGLSYLVAEVGVWQVWLLSLTGVVLLGLAVLRDAREGRTEVLLIGLAATVTTVAIAVSRPLHPGVQFYEARYFAFLAGVPMALLPLGLVGQRRWAAMLLLVPVAVVTGLVDHRVAGVLAETSRDTRTLHTEVGQTIAQTLPADAVVGVEGAGAPRYFAPRSMKIVDLVGLNDRRAAHLHFDPPRKMCHFVRSGLTHLAVPTDWLPLFSPVFDGTVIRRFDDPHYTQILPARPLTVVLVELRGARPDWSQRCGTDP